MRGEVKEEGGMSVVVSPDIFSKAPLPPHTPP